MEADWSVDLLATCGRIHGRCCGTFPDALTDEQLRAAVDALVGRLAAWTASGESPWAAYDDAVKALVVAAVTEGRNELAKSLETR